MAIGLATAGGTAIEDPPLARFLFGTTRAAPLWPALRVFIGYRWPTGTLTRGRSAPAGGTAAPGGEAAPGGAHAHVR